MTETEMRTRRCCFTGHRPEKLTQSERTVCSALEKEIRQAVKDGLTVFITGMARGVDIWAAEIVLRLRNEGQPIRLICATPYEGFEKGWRADWQDRYNAVMQSADLVRFICPSLVIAASLDSSSGAVFHIKITGTDPKVCNA